MSTADILGLLPQWGPWLVGLTTFLSCLMLPVPSSLLMLAAGAFTATGDLSLAAVGAAALGGAVAGDAIGYTLSARLLSRLAAKPGAAGLLDRAAGFLDRRGVLAIFLTRWLFSPLGPWTNLAAGAAGYGLARFIVPAIAGEMVWVAVYLGLGRAFGAQYQAAADLAGSVLGLLAGLAVTVFLGNHLWRRRHRDPI